MHTLPMQGTVFDGTKCRRPRSSVIWCIGDKAAPFKCQPFGYKRLPVLYPKMKLEHSLFKNVSMQRVAFL